MASVGVDPILQQTMGILVGLDEASRVKVLKFAELLAAGDDDDDVALYDAAKANDDGYRISSKDLRAKYGL